MTKLSKSGHLLLGHLPDVSIHLTLMIVNPTLKNLFQLEIKQKPNTSAHLLLQLDLCSFLYPRAHPLFCHLPDVSESPGRAFSDSLIIHEPNTRAHLLLGHFPDHHCPKLHEGGRGGASGVAHYQRPPACGFKAVIVQLWGCFGAAVGRLWSGCGQNAGCPGTVHLMLNSIRSQLQCCPDKDLHAPCRTASALSGCMTASSLHSCCASRAACHAPPTIASCRQVGHNGELKQVGQPKVFLDAFP